MMTILHQLVLAARRRAAYNRTRSELRRLSPNTALDLGIYQDDVNRIARNAVYGR